ncbi:hypothetical protein VTK56DRAFT_2701 [Thermocarpiscus australiensis]
MNLWAVAALPQPELSPRLQRLLAQRHSASESNRTIARHEHFHCPPLVPISAPREHGINRGSVEVWHEVRPRVLFDPCGLLGESWRPTTVRIKMIVRGIQIEWQAEREPVPAVCSTVADRGCYVTVLSVAARTQGRSRMCFYTRIQTSAYKLLDLAVV